MTSRTDDRGSGIKDRGWSIKRVKSNGGKEVDGGVEVDRDGGLEVESNGGEEVDDGVEVDKDGGLEVETNDGN
ncbi:hypothetical protein LR48_Vigan05g080100 [Vigna angularis]|uniref:Uncharacterized protein n=1 Tax=Phaseolus angularis TaxID=3914 RepID=A0A0L9UKU9_PHAAN|nr:hypothetical protein LR48_Vigan05g080100 [Vigna angularis]